jgi:sugar phosphate isomerase/epimerase
VFVSCSTHCFAQQPLESALRHIVELEFNRVDLAVYEEGAHLRPSSVAENLEAALHRLRHGPSLNFSAIDIRFGAIESSLLEQRFTIMSRLAKSLMVAVLAIPAAPCGTPFEEEASRLRRLCELAGGEGLVLTVKTESDTLTCDPATAVALCEVVPGLGLTLDPSHYINGPHQGGSFDEVFPFVQNVHFRDTGRKPGEFQVQVGQGEVEYGRVVAQLERFGYDRALTVAIHDRPDNPFDIDLEVRKLKLLLESLL